MNSSLVRGYICKKMATRSFLAVLAFASVVLATTYKEGDKVCTTK